MRIPKVKSGQWIQPAMKGFKFVCCDCSLSHTIDFRITGSKALAKLLGSNLLHVQMRCKRDNKLTKTLRKKDHIILGSRTGQAMQRIALALLFLILCPTLDMTHNRTMMSPCHHVAYGVASWYGSREHGKVMANGKRFNMHALTAASRSLPFGMRLRVTNIRTGQAVAVMVTDRGPYVKGRAIDLSHEAARRIGMIGEGLQWVTIERQ